MHDLEVCPRSSDHNKPIQNVPYRDGNVLLQLVVHKCMVLTGPFKLAIADYRSHSHQVVYTFMQKEVPLTNSCMIIITYMPTCYIALLALQIQNLTIIQSCNREFCSLCHFLNPHGVTRAMIIIIIHNIYLFSVDNTMHVLWFKYSRDCRSLCNNNAIR